MRYEQEISRKGNEDVQGRSVKRREEMSRKEKMRGEEERKEMS